MNKKVLIVTNHSDIHADLVVEKIRARGHSPFRLNLDEFPAQFALDAEFRDGTWKSTFASAPRTVRLGGAGVAATRDERKPGAGPLAGGASRSHPQTLC